MPTRIGAPVLTVDAGEMHKIDTSNVENLFSMWTGESLLQGWRTVLPQLTHLLTVFNRCADSMEEGHRLANLSWRLWNRETLCCDSKPQFPDTPTSLTPRPRSEATKDVPELSTSVDSTSSEEYEQLSADGSHSPPVQIKNVPSTKSSFESLSSCRRKHISSFALEKMVMSIKETKITQKQDMTGLPVSITQALPTVIPLSPPPVPHARIQEQQPKSSASPKRQSAQRASQSSTSTIPMSSPESVATQSQQFGSETSTELVTPHSIVRGFTLNKISSSLRSHSLLAPSASPVPIKPALRSRPNEQSAVGGKFMLGGSSEDESSFDDSHSLRPNESSLTAALKRSPTNKKTTSFKEEVESRVIADRTHDEDAIDTDDEEDEDGDEDDSEDEEDDDEGNVSESAIEDDEDDEEWEDSATDSGGSSPSDKHLFQRVDSKHNLVSRRSLLTTQLHQSERAAALAGMASSSQAATRRSRSRASSPNRLSVASSPVNGTALQSQGTNIPRSKPIIMTTSNTHPPPLSPKTTRRNMLATELTESLRKHLLWERQQKNTTANAVLKRRHTAHDMANLHAFPEAAKSGATSQNSSWNAYNFDHDLGEYNSRGW